MNFHFDLKYLPLTIIFFLIEIFIALFVDDKIIRPFIGDAIVVVLLYCFVRIFLNMNYLKIAVGVLFFAFLI